MNEMSHKPAPVAVHRAPQGFSFDTVAIGVLSVAAALATILFIPSANISFIYTKVLVVALGVLIAFSFFILARLTRGNIIVPPVPLLCAFWVVPLAYAASALFSGVGLRAAFFGNQLETDTLGFMLILALFATLAALVFRRTNEYRRLFLVLSGVFVFVLLAQIAFLIFGHLIPKSVSPSQNLIGSFMDLGMLVGLGLTLLLIAHRFLTFSPRLQKIFWVVLPVSLFVLALTNSFLVWILVALVAFGLFIESILHRTVSVDEELLEGVETLVPVQEAGVTREMFNSHSLAVPLITLVIALFFMIGGSTIGAALTTAFGTNVLDVRPSWTSTFAVGSHTYASSPVFGSGPNTFGQQWLRSRDRTLNNTVFWNVNFNSGIGFIPTSFVTEGALGALAWIAFIGLFIVLGLRALLLRTPTDEFVRFVSVASFTGTLYLFALMLFAVPGPIVLMLGFLLAGIFVSSLRYAGTRQEWGIVFSRTPRIGFVIVFSLTLFLLASVVAAYVVIEQYLADYSSLKATSALAANNLDAAQADISQSLLFMPTAHAYQIAAAIGMARMDKIASDSTLTASQIQSQFQSALTPSVQSALAATRLAPRDYQNWLVLATVYQTVVPLGVTGAYANAKDAYQHAIALNPTDPTLPYALARLDIANKDGAAAEADLAQAISLKQDYTEAIFLLSQLEAQQGKAKEALQAAQAAAYFAPNDPTILLQVGILQAANGNTADAIATLSQAVQLNPQYANARYSLAVMYASQSQYANAIAQLQAIAAVSSSNAQAVAANLTALQAGHNPFPASQVGTLGAQQPQVTNASSTTSTHTTTHAATSTATK
jgi:tetratricopeptide (TPR) repeat protein